MRKKQVVALCVCNVVIYAGISGLVGLMPVYLTQLGADSTLIGFFLASSYLSLAISNVIGGGLSDRFQHRKFLLILGGALATPVAWLMSQATTVGHLLVLMAFLWFVTGIAMTMINILTGLFAEVGSQGRSFGILNLSAGFGLFFGGMVSGQIVDRWGFPTLFMLLALFYLLIPFAGQFTQDRMIAIERKIAVSSLRAVFTDQTFALLFVASILAQSANIVIALSRPLIMNSLHFNATAIGIASSIGGLITLPLPLLIGWLADRLRRKFLLIACFLAPALGLIVLTAAVDVWHFWVSSIFGTILGISVVVGAALIIDIFPEELLGTSLALLNATPWIGIVIGFSIGGMAIHTFQMLPALLLALLPSLLAIFLLTRIPQHAV